MNRFVPRYSCLTRLPASRSIGLLMTGLGLVSLFVSGCSETKVDRCNKLVTLANKASQDIQALETQNSPPTAKFQAAADILDRATKSMQALQLNDPKLQGFQQQLVELYSRDRDSNRSLINPADAPTLRQAMAQLQTNHAAQTQVVQAINTYCQAP
ncbi:hypothetical protein [Alkalinema sp. FACHB-956]|uniref:hypothetical protein n=1 Tax=Alkalinema sp. FACHB-956 TaxID=2692768 RepID=UPI00168206E0|nr:hypothetical protein [Alkalinema sp. FACHB-956]MBD2325272.1 hypothetical protein [Alkalinema sp. FACHB-956]